MLHSFRLDAFSEQQCKAHCWVTHPRPGVCCRPAEPKSAPRKQHQDSSQTSAIILAHVQVYRTASEAIGCSLAKAAESESYTHYLEAAADQPDPGLHVVYINHIHHSHTFDHSGLN